MKYRILFDGRVLAHRFTTGVERYAKELLRHLDVDIAIPSSDRRTFQHFWEHFVLPKISKNYDLLFCPANMCPLYKAGDVKFVVTIHDVSFLNFPDSFSFMYREYYRMLTNGIVKRTDHIITVSDFEKWELIFRYRIRPERITSIYSGVSDVFLENFNPSIEKRQDYILYVGNLSKRKNFHGLIKAFSLVYKEIDKKLIIVGMKPDIMKIDRSVDSIIKLIPDEYIEFKGHINDEKELRDLYRKAAAFVFPSFYESFGFPLLEAMACGAPVVASRVAAIPEICRESAVYINPFDIEDICDGIIKVVKDDRLRERLVASGRERALEFTWEKSAKKHLEVFERVISGS